MIKIDKSTVSVPANLASQGKGAREADKLRLAFDAGNTTFSFDKSIYAHKSVKDGLRTLQHNKCCFCESRINHVSHGDVEHFRPKSGYQIDEDQELVKPGYYWLAYDFSNLFFCCQICNQFYKKNYFPLADETKRANSHRDDLSLEESLILHPEFDAIDEHLVFEAEMIKPKNGSRKGIETIKRTGLNRIPLLEERFSHLKKLRALAKIARSDDRDADEYRAYFKEFSQPEDLYSAMVRANFPDLV